MRPFEVHYTGKSYKCPAWIFRLVFNKNESWNGANSVKTILGLSVQGGNSGKTILGLSVQGGNSEKTIMGLSVQGGNSGKTLLGLSVQGGNRYGSTLVLSNKNPVDVINIFILQHGFCSTKPG